MNVAILTTVLSGLIIGAIILAVIVAQTLRRTDSIELIQGKIKNSNSAIADAIPYLKITNEWK